MYNRLWEMSTWIFINVLFFSSNKEVRWLQGQTCKGIVNTSFLFQGWKITMKLALHDFSYMFGDILKNLERSKDALFRSADIAHFREAQDARSLFTQHYQAQVRQETLEKIMTVRQWLKYQSCDRYHEELRERREGFPETTKWVLRERVMMEWLTGSTRRDQPFWISGIPGAGNVLPYIAKKESSYFDSRQNDPLQLDRR